MISSEASSELRYVVTSEDKTQLIFQIPHLDKLLDIVYNTFWAATSSLSGRDISSWVKEVNHVIIVSILSLNSPI